MAKEYGLAESALSKPKADKKPAKKSIRKISHEAAHSGGYVIKHEHHSADHADETHLAADKAALMAHMEANEPQAAGGAPEPEAQPEAAE